MINKNGWTGEIHGTGYAPSHDAMTSSASAYNPSTGKGYIVFDTTVDADAGCFFTKSQQLGRGVLYFVLQPNGSVCSFLSLSRRAPDDPLHDDLVL